MGVGGREMGGRGCGFRVAVTVLTQLAWAFWRLRSVALLISARVVVVGGAIPNRSSHCAANACMLL